ncbi:MAG TPA: hypothetical protein VF746_15350 [Longimicrobium sp.]|jgi:hypothetical protein
MARKPNYGFEKRQKEMQRKAKQEEKAERKRLRKEGAHAGEGDVDSAPEASDETPDLDDDGA